jgi:uncharacterized protein
MSREYDGKILTYTGKLVAPFNLKPEDVCIEDIAHSLSLQCRFNGHCEKFYSVAEHCVHMADLCMFSLVALMHDASEAYLLDIPKPLKELPEFAFYRKIEAEVQGIIERALDMPQYEDGAIEADIHYWDKIVGSTEALLLMGRSWGGVLSGEDLDIFTQEGFGWTPKEAEKQFLIYYNNLKVKNI